MDRGIRILATILLLITLPGCAGSGASKPESVTAPGADIPALTSFGWDQSAGSAATDPPLTILDGNIRNAVRSQLLKKGYVETDDQPDFRIRYETVSYETVKKKSNPISIGIGVGSWGGNVGGGVGTSVGVGGGSEENIEHRLTIRAIQQQDNKEVWVGTSTGAIESSSSASAVDKAVAGVMQGFPAKRS